jgi:hypothetical protein
MALLVNIQGPGRTLMYKNVITERSLVLGTRDAEKISRKFVTFSSQSHARSDKTEYNMPLKM